MNLLTKICNVNSNKYRLIVYKNLSPVNIIV